MPKKTKKEKIRAQIHKNTIPEKNSIYKLSEQEINEAKHVKKDLTKTGIITFFILCVEFLAFYATLRGAVL